MIDFWDVHGLWFIFFMCLFPRLTMLFATVWGGFWWWIGLIFAPRLTVAILATIYFSQTNIVLVVFAWIWALGGEGAEKSTYCRNRG
jgi:hypothetical protein